MSPNELDNLNVLFQRRHLFEHNNGMVDQQYLDKTQDAEYVVGQRLIMREADTRELIRLLKKLSKGLLSLT